MASNIHSEQIPSPIREKLTEVHRKHSWVELRTGIARAATFLLIMMMLSMMFDAYFALFNPAIRLTLTLISIATGVIVLGHYLFQLFAHKHSWEETALQIDDSIPELQERWSTVTDLSSHQNEAGERLGSPQMIAKVSEEALELEHLVQPQQVINPVKLRFWTKILIGVGAVLLLGLLLSPIATSRLLGRFWLPLSDISLTTIESKTGDVTVPRGEKLELNAILTGVKQENGVLYLKQGEQTDEIPMEIVAEDQYEFQHSIKSVDEPFAYRFQAGDGQTEWHQVSVADRPAFEQIQFKMTPPEYSKLPVEQQKQLPPRLRALQGSELEVTFKVTQPLESFLLKLNEENSLELSPISEQTFQLKKTLTESFSFSPIMTNEAGLSNRKPPVCRISVYEDRVPAVSMSSPADDLAVPAGDLIEIDFVAQDDFGITQAELVVYQESPYGGEPQELKVIEIPLGDQQDARHVSGTAQLNLEELNLPEKSVISYAVRVFDSKKNESDLTANSPAEDQLASAEMTNQSADNSNKDQDSQDQSDDSNQTNSQEADDSSSKSKSSEANNASGSKSNNQKKSKTNSSRSDDTKNTNSDNQSNQSGVQQNSKVNSSDGNSKANQNSDSQSSDQQSSPNSGKNSQSNSQQNSTNQGSDSQSQQQNNNSNSSPQSNSQQNDASAANSNSENTAPENRKFLSIGNEKGNNSGSNNSSGDGTNQKQSSGQNGNPENSQKGSNGNSQGKQSGSNSSQSKQGQSQQNSKNSSSSSSSSSSSNNQEQSLTPDSKSPRNESENKSGGIEGPPRPENDMIRRNLNQGQAGQSSRRKIIIDEWAGSFKSQLRKKNQLAIDPVLKKLKELLEKSLLHNKKYKASLETAGESNQPETGSKKAFTLTSNYLQGALNQADILQLKSADTPYAFIGLQIVEIKHTHISPALTTWKQTPAIPEKEEKLSSIQQTKFHIERALELLAKLTKQYETQKRNEEVSEKIDKLKTMYQLFVEDSFTLLKSVKPPINSKERKMQETELTEEQMRQIEEFLKRQQEILGELAAILAEDPRLLRRFMDMQRGQADTLRDQFTILHRQQRRLLKQGELWQKREEASAKLEPEEKKLPIPILIMKTLKQQVDAIGEEAASFHEKFVAWSPLDVELDDESLAEAIHKAARIATQASELQQASLPDQPEQAEKLIKQLTEFNAWLPDNSDPNEAELHLHLTRRLRQSEKLLQDTQGWLSKRLALEEGDFNTSAQADQYLLLDETLILADKLSDLQTTLRDFPSEIKQTAADLMRTIQFSIPKEMTSSESSLNAGNLPRSLTYQEKAVEQFEIGEKQFDDLFDQMIEHLDSQPPPPPPEGDLQFPEKSVEELLAMLQAEMEMQELLGFPNARMNIQIMSDWMTPPTGGGGGSMGIGAMGANGMSQLGRAAQAQNELIQAQPPLEDDSQKKRKWNSLISTLEEGLRQNRGKLSPEQYRRAINQYFEALAREQKQESK